MTVSGPKPGTRPRQDRLRLVSHFPGRLRVRAETFRVLPEVAEEVAERLLAEQGVTAVTASDVTGSLLVLYEPRELQLPRVIQLLIRVGGLHGLEVDKVDDWMARPDAGTRIRDALGDANDALKGRTRGKLDLKVAVPGALAGVGVGMLLAGRFVMPFWYDFMFWSYVVFHNSNLAEIVPSPHHPRPNQGHTDDDRERDDHPRR